MYKPVIPKYIPQEGAKINISCSSCKRRPGRKPNKKRAEKQRTRRESRRITTAAPWGRSSSLTAAAAATAAVGDSQQQQLAAALSSSCRQFTPTTDWTIHHHHHPCCPRSSRETDNNQNRYTAQTTPSSTAATSSTRDAGEQAAKSVAIHQQHDPSIARRNPSSRGADGLPDTPNRSVTPPFKDPPTPPPMSHYLPSDPDRVICHLCFKNVHYLMYNQCEFCHYRLKFTHTKMWSFTCRNIKRK